MRLTALPYLAYYATDERSKCGLWAAIIVASLCGTCLGPVTLSTRPHHAENCKINLLNLKNILVLYNPNAPSRTQIQVDAHLNIKESSVKCILNPPQLIAEPTATSLNLKLNPPQLRPNLQS